MLLIVKFLFLPEMKFYLSTLLLWGFITERNLVGVTIREVSRAILGLEKKYDPITIRIPSVRELIKE